MTLDQDAVRLWRTPLFSEVDPAQLKMLAFAAERIKLGKGENLVEKDETTDAAFIIVAGSARIISGGNERILEPGAIIGEISLLTGKPSQVTVRAEGSVQALKISRKLIARYAAEFPEIGQRMLDAWKRRMERTAANLKQVQALLRQDAG